MRNRGQQSPWCLTRRYVGMSMLFLTCSGAVIFMFYVVDSFSIKPLGDPKTMLLAAIPDHTDVADTRSVDADQSPQTERSCPDVMTMMTQGRWIRRPMTPQEVEKMQKFHKHVREEQFGMPKGLQRTDRKCGSVSFRGDNSPSGRRKTAHWFRALCDPDGDTPCCYNNHCVGNVPVEKCTCPQCFDTRRAPLDAEYATWRPFEPACDAVSRMMSVEEVCELLEGATVYVIGDSLMRHIFTALLLAVRGDEVTGAFRKNMPEDLKSKCSEIYAFTEKVCRRWVDHNVKACRNKTASLVFMDKGVSKSWTAINATVSSLTSKPRSLVLLGVGIHGGLYPEQTFHKALLPVLNSRSPTQVWPKLVWANVHHFGWLKSPANKRQQNSVALQFNEKMRELLRPWGVAVMDTFNMTVGVRSFDGAHYGYGVNRVKAQILLHFLQELRWKNQW